MDEVWQNAQSEAVVRSLLMRTLEDLRIARDRLNQNSSNSSRPPGSMAPWQRDETKASSSSVHSQTRKQEDEDTATGAPVDESRAPEANAPQSGGDKEQAKPSERTQTPALPGRRRAGRAVGAPGHGRPQKLTPTHFEYKHPTHCTACQHPFTQDDPAQAWTAWDTLELQPLNHSQDTPAHAAPLRLGLHIEVTRHTLMQQRCPCGHHTRAQAQCDVGTDLCGKA